MFYTCVVAICFAACSGDEYIDEQTEGRKINVTLRLSVDNNTTTRAWQDTNAETDNSEMMHNWTVVVVNSSGKVEEIVNQTPETGNNEIDTYTTTVSLTTGQKTFYSFANIDISSWGITKGNSLPSGFDNKKYPDDANGIVPPSFGGEGGGIPMSNKQTLSIETTTTSVDLIVVRMLAKMKFQITNATSSNITINSITLSEITTGPVYLLPKYDTGGGADSMELGNLLPNIPAGSAKADYTFSIADGLTVEAGNITPVETTFYINESEATAAYPKYFVITLNVDKGEGVEDEQRYALLEWNQIARNEYRIIPIILDDYILDIEPQDFPPIGVLPASVKEEDGKFTVTFHAGGHFHIVPKVKQASSSTWLKYGDGVGQWSYVSWSNDATNSIYVVEEPASTTDASDNGGIPVWDATNHYIFGKLKQDVTGSAYHELKVNVKKSEEVTRELTYKLYIIKE